ncbi:MAG: thioredoxin family protein [Candidatus Omnitrophica bacterium]|nr:thioredoxin family protein [Candidatus Omnitrophota bacterium]
MRIRVFGKKDCAKCETTKNKFNHFLQKNNHLDSVNLEFHDMDTVDGFAEGAYNDVLKIPTTIIENQERILARWEGEVPKTEEFTSHFK